MAAAWAASTPALGFDEYLFRISDRRVELFERGAQPLTPPLGSGRIIIVLKPSSQDDGPLRCPLSDQSFSSTLHTVCKKPIH